MKKLITLMVMLIIISVNFCVFIYAQGTPYDSETIATLLPWNEFNEKIGSITDVRDVKSIKKSDNKKEWLTDDNLISIGWNSEVYAWFDNKDDQWILYYYTDADVIYLNEDSAWMFQHFHELQDISWLSNWDTSSVTSMYGMFENCWNLTDISWLSWWDTSSVTNMSSMFRWCSNLTGLSWLSWWSTSSVTNMNDMFSYCSELTDISWLSWWDTSSVTNMSSMFSHCNKLTDISWLSWWNTSSVTNISSMFYDCKKLTDISWLSWWDISSVTNMNSMFRWCSNLTDISWLSNWDTSNVTEMSQMFSDCNELTDISWLSWWDTSSATNISSMFSYCVNLRKTDLNNRDTSKVEYMWSMFYWCSSLSDVSWLSWWNTSSVTSMHGMFEWCSSLTNISWLSNWNTSSVENMGSMFRWCSNLIDVSWLSWWDTSSVTNMEGMFAWSTSLSIIDLSSWNTSNETFMRRMFQWCNNLEKIYVSNKFTVQNAYNISMFEWCTKLVWWNWTTYDANHVDAEYARIDKPWEPWYFTAKEQWNIENAEIITLKPWLNSFSTPAVVESISFSNGWDNISFAKMVNWKRTPVTFTDSNVKSVIRPLDGFIVRNSNSEDVTMTIVYDTDIDINDALPQKQLDAWWNFLWITKTVSPFETVANAVVKDVIDFTFWNTNKIDLSKLRDATSFMLWKAYWVFVNNSNWIYGWRNNPDVLPNATLVNNLTKVVKFPVNEVSKKIVFDGTYTALADHSIIWFNIEHSNVDLENCHNDISYNDIDFNLYVNWELVGSNLNPSSNDIILNSCQYFWSLHFNGIINVKKWDSLQIKIEWELNSLAYWDTDKESSYLYKLSFFGVGWNEDILASANLAPVKIVDDSNELSVQAMSGKNTVLLNEPNAVLWRFMVMPTNSTQWYFDNLVLKVTNPAWSTLDYDDIELRIDWTEVDEWDWQSSDWRLWYEDLDKLVDSLWSEVEVSIKNPDDWDYVLDIIDINTVWTSHFGKDPIITFNKRFESALVYIESQRNEDDQTHYILWVDKYDDSDVIPSLRLFTWYDVEQNECVGSLSFDKLSWESFYFEDWDEIVINNGNDAQLIKCIEYIVAYDGQECVDLDENNNCNKYMPVMQIRSRVSINKDDYLDYFKIRTWGFRKVFGRDSVGNGVCWDWVIDAWENCSNCPVDLGDICNTNCNSVDDLQFSHSIDKNGLITLNWTPNRQVYIEVKDSSEADWDYGSDHWISEDKVNSPFVFDAWWHPNYYKFFAYDNYQQCDHYKRYVVDATNVCSWVDNLDIQHQIQNGKIILSWDSDVNLSIATVAPPLTLEMLESGQVTTTSETVENGTFSYDIDGSGDYIFILENNFWCDNERYYTVHVD